MATPVVARSPEAILKEILSPSFDGPALVMPVFIAMYRPIWKPTKLLEHIIATYNDTISLKPTREACLNLLLEWIQARLIPDFLRPQRKSNRKAVMILPRLLEFVESLERRAHTLRDFSSCYTIKLALLRTWSRRRRAGFLHYGLQQQIEAQAERQQPSPLVPASSSSPDLRKKKDRSEKRFFLVYVWVPDARNVALRFALLELAMFRRIAHREFLSLAWRDRTAPHPASAIRELIARSNNVSYWVASRIIKRKSPEKRVDMLNKFIEIADACYELHNYNTLMEILGGLNSHSISRLKKTWEKLPAPTKETFSKLESLMDSKGNFKSYRAKVQELRHAGVYLRDMVSLDEAMTTKRERGINIEKFNVILNVLTEIDYVLRQDARSVHKRAAYVTRGMNDDVKDDDEAMAYLNTVHGFSENELLHRSHMAEAPRSQADTDATVDESTSSTMEERSSTAGSENKLPTPKSSTMSLRGSSLALAAAAAAAAQRSPKNKSEGSSVRSSNSARSSSTSTDSGQ